MDLFDDDSVKFKEAKIFIYGKKRKIRYKVCDYIWNRKERFRMRFVVLEFLDMDGVKGPQRIILGCNNQEINPLTIIRNYVFRVKIELHFRDMNQYIGLESYHFWSKDVPVFKPRKAGTPPPLESVEGEKAKKNLAKCLKRVETHLQICMIAHGISKIVALELSQAGIKESSIVWKRTYSKNSVSTSTAQNYLSQQFDRVKRNETIGKNLLSQVLGRVNFQVNKKRKVA